MRPLALRAHPLVFGVVVFLASESMLFAALLAAWYDLRGMAPAWPPSGIVPDAHSALIGTVMLGVGSLTMGYAQISAARDKFLYARAALLITLVLAFGFTAITIHDWATSNFRIDSNAYGTLFFVLTGTHLAHVLAGAVLLIALSLFLRRRAFVADHNAGVEAIAYYWHFVFVIWLAVWATIYLVR